MHVCMSHAWSSVAGHDLFVLPCCRIADDKPNEKIAAFDFVSPLCPPQPCTVRACTPQLQTLQFVSCGSVLWLVSLLLKTCFLFKSYCRTAPWPTPTAAQNSRSAATTGSCTTPGCRRRCRSLLPTATRSSSSGTFIACVLGMQHGMRPVSSWSHV